MRLTVLVSIVLAAVASPAVANPSGGGLPAAWESYTNPRYGFTIGYPVGVFTPQPAPENGAGQVWVSQDGRARLVASAGFNSSEETLEGYRRFVMQETYAGANIDYAPVRGSWFVLSGTKGADTFYERITFACGGRVIYGWQMIYPTEQKAFYDRIVEQVHRTFRPGRGELGQC